ncbi:MAG: flagellar biosynthesis protein FlhA [Alphaproteobacteria bacterium]|jgi:flagellar biosynthesis protein FlhA|nr:flagellar biosynthesis protein FlhA [Alphaproteobacteria bacterium]MBT4020268.1 flagellar biosynthesis protein FlhA [Alphaproteobacteria bacterium]MBT4965459.1 flagellar biosynthesis protein FlhA [Alphaproteobacteria bacterium]MBT5158478.1 flagellar biosynthesis protein FlhA [Alphaproteobacteria bacterium]MBT5918795.1 flagellar biosynthesis protein FlhA [Alphaproteobacteria bacterium]
MSEQATTPDGEAVGMFSFMRGDIAFALGIMAILTVLFIPLPPWLLDISFSISITFSVLILMTALFIAKPLEFSAFPTVLLIATLLRLSLNVASTRLILSEGHHGGAAAGRVIQAFGDFVISGNFIIGIVVFGILVIVNFVVITKGSQRIAEVAARFTLDAMPGKQMAIDADLSSGLVDENEARDRRKNLEDESNFFGAMDGASKFVRGDAVAGLLITFINIIGGIIIGVAQKDMSFGGASESYTLLTVGDGLVSQIPALIVSIAAGILVSKAGVSGTADKAIFSQLGGYPKALGVSSFLMIGLAIIPNMPMFPFLLLSGITGTLAFVAMQNNERAVIEADEAEREQIDSTPVEEPISTALAIDDLRLELGYGLLPLINDERGYKLTDQIKALRRQLASEMGFVMPSVRILDNMQLPANGYVIRVKEIESGAGEVRPGQLLVMDPRGEPITLPGEETTEPTFGLPATWVDEAHREEASFRGYTVVDPSTVVSTHLTETIKENMSDLLSYAETQKLLDDLPKEQQKLIGDIIPAQISTSGVQRILQNLLNERISIRDLPTVLEGVAEATAFTQNFTQVTEHVRSRLARQISNSQVSAGGYIPLITLSPEWEQAFAESIIVQGDDRQLAMAPMKLQEFITKVRQVFERTQNEGEAAVLLTSPGIRPFVRSIIERFRPATVVMSQNEIHPKAKIRTLGQV